MPKSSMHRLKTVIEDYYPYWVAVHALLVVAVLWAMQKSFFYSSAIDGFSYGIYAIDRFSWAEVFSHPLSIVHLLRYIAVAPWWWIRESDWAPLISALLIVLFTLPAVVIPLGNTEKKPSFLRVIFLYLPCVLSMRAVLVSLGLCYVFLLVYSKFRSRTLYILSALFVNLSSAGVLLWLILHACHYKNVKNLFRYNLRIVGFVVFAVMIFSISASISSKLVFFKKEMWAFSVNTQASQPGHAPDTKPKKGGLTLSPNIIFIDPLQPKNTHNAPQRSGAAPTNTIKEMVSDLLGAEGEALPFWKKSILLLAVVADRNTIFISMKTGNHLRAITYILLFFMYLYCAWRIYHHTGARNGLFLFLGICFPVFFMEGLGVMSLLPIMAIILLEQKALSSYVLQTGSIQDNDYG